MNFFKYISQDRQRNKKNTKGALITFLFRIAAFISSKTYLKYTLFIYLFFYRFFVEWVLGIELPWNTSIGSGLILYHGQSLVINKNTIIGKNCVLRHCVTIGNAIKSGKCPVIGDNVDVGANVCVIGDIKVGDNVTIGAGSVVVKNVPSNSLIVGNPARVIRQLKEDLNIDNL